jgi:hypothetical protein
MITVAWHVLKDLKISHKEAHIIDDFLKCLDAEFGKEAPLNISQGKVHDYLETVMDFSKPQQIMMTMIDHIKMVPSNIPQDMIGSAATPAASHLFSQHK